MSKNDMCMYSYPAAINSFADYVYNLVDSQTRRIYSDDFFRSVTNFVVLAPVFLLYPILLAAAFIIGAAVDTTKSFFQRPSNEPV